jgi:hypothetical protein
VRVVVVNAVIVEIADTVDVEVMISVSVSVSVDLVVLVLVEVTVSITVTIGPVTVPGPPESVSVTVVVVAAQLLLVVELEYPVVVVAAATGAEEELDHGVVKAAVEVLVEFDQFQDHDVVAEAGAPRLLDVAFEAAIVLVVLFCVQVWVRLPDADVDMELEAL